MWPRDLESFFTAWKVKVQAHIKVHPANVSRKLLSSRSDTLQRRNNEAASSLKEKADKFQVYNEQFIIKWEHVKKKKKKNTLNNNNTCRPRRDDTKPRSMSHTVTTEKSLSLFLLLLIKFISLCTSRLKTAVEVQEYCTLQGYHSTRQKMEFCRNWEVEFRTERKSKVKTRLSWSSGSQLWLGVIRLKTFSPDKSSPLARCLLPAHPTPALLSSKSPASLSAPASCPPRCQEQQPALHPPRQVSSCFLPVFQCGAPTCPGVCLWNKIQLP